MPASFPARPALDRIGSALGARRYLLQPQFGYYRSLPQYDRAERPTQPKPALPTTPHLAENPSSFPLGEQKPSERIHYGSLKISFLWFLGKVTVVQEIFQACMSGLGTAGTVSEWTLVPAIPAVSN